MLTVFIVSGLPAVRAGLAALVQADPECRVIGVASPDSNLVSTLAEQPADVALLDLNGTDAVETVIELTDALPGLRPLLLGPLPEGERLPVALAGRVWGYIPRSATGDEVLAAVRALASGLIAIDPALAVATFSLQSSALEMSQEERAGGDLTQREREVLQLIALGLPNKAIASRLGISEHTVKFHVAAILSKLGATSRTEAVRLGARRGLVIL